ncbi:PilZ domain-containing protein [Sphingomonas sp. HITSZ_GF]|uniref:PilZ domain-containing protein n=1 Tax=Sphingomonas sp. HITSZ_GF TaxID=3037247 RepID=UPI00240D1B18|nr:PilZ domain-containing protein [Sphingomonas sp. HITSZ_GF]MDG2535046.1 PilZ domain-containing protein [Sphingomonas sp. HITSZ_GF]
MSAYAPILTAGNQDRAPRKNLLLAATIEADGLKVPVRIRNLSEGGAMLDGSVLPRPCTRLLLRRSEIEVGARVIWQSQGKCGVSFETSAVTVDEWVSGTRVANFAGYAGQARVDAIQEAVRGGAVLPAEPAPEPAADLANLGERLVEEIYHVRELLDSLGERLVEDPQVLATHLESLQNLDRASQILDHLGSVLGAEDPAAAAKAVAMQDLRARLMR